MTYSIPVRLAHVVWQHPDAPTPTIYLAPLADGPALVLDGTSALIWLSALSADADGTDVVAMVAASVGQEPSAIETEVMSFLGDLCRRGLLSEQVGPV